MAETFTILGTRKDVEFLGGTTTREVYVSAVQTAPHGVYFESRIDAADFTAARAKEQARGFTIVYALLFDIPGVADVAWTQQETPAGQLQDHIIVYVISTSGNSSGTIDVPYSAWTQDHVAALVKKLRDELDAAEA